MKSGGGNHVQTQGIAQRTVDSKHDWEMRQCIRKACDDVVIEVIVKPW